MTLAVDVSIRKRSASPDLTNSQNANRPIAENTGVYTRPSAPLLSRFTVARLVSACVLQGRVSCSSGMDWARARELSAVVSRGRGCRHFFSSGEIRAVGRV